MCSDSTLTSVDDPVLLFPMATMSEMGTGWSRWISESSSDFTETGRQLPADAVALRNRARRFKSFPAHGREPSRPGRTRTYHFRKLTF